MESNRYAKLINGKLSFAKQTVTWHGKLVFNPTADILVDLGYKRFVDQHPETDEQHYTLAAGYDETETTISVKYEIHEIETPEASDSQDAASELEA